MEIRTQDGQVMYEAEFRAYTLANGGPSWETTTVEVLASLGAVALLEGAQPTATRYQTVFRDGVEQIGGQWFTKYSVADIDDEAKAAKDAEQAKSVRQTRDDKLKETDWLVIKSVETQSVFSPEWAAYRQALRDITAQSGFPWEVIWPDAP
jgi:hypothetical protein